MRLNYMLHHTLNYLIDREDLINWYVNIYYVVGGIYYCYFIFLRICWTVHSVAVLNNFKLIN